MSNKVRMKEGIAIFITAFSIQGGSQSYAYNPIYIPYTQLVLEHSSYMTFTSSPLSLFLYCLFLVKLLIATQGLSAYLRSHTGFSSQLYLTWKQPPILLWSFQLACLLQLEESPFFQTPCSSNAFTLFSWFLLHPKKV